MPHVSIVIPNYNGVEHLPVCLDSIGIQTFTDYEIIVVDNGSADNSVSLLQSRRQKIVVFPLTENKGFAAAVNYGIQRSSGALIALLNNDIELEPQWLQSMVDAIESDKTLGSVACKMLNYYDRTLIDAAGDVLTRAGNIIGRGYGDKDSANYDKTEYVFGACAGAGLYRKEVFTTVGYFDEDYFAWFEDADHHFRSQLAGYRSLYVPAARCYHKRGATAKKMSALAVRLHARNHLYYLIINIPPAIIWTNFFLIVFSRLKNWLTIVREGDAKALFWAWGKVFIELPKLYAKRGRVQSSRRVEITYIRSMMTN
ncbi:MAG: glycosyltransferase family 2 protein [Bacteroidota bacterium]